MLLPGLSGPSHPPAAGGKPRQLVVLLHGLGADGNDLIGLAPVFSQILPHAEFLSPNAPFPCDMAPYGYQWFSVQDRSFDAVMGGVRAAAPMLDAFIDDALKSRGLSEKELALVGFSQGTMMSLHVGLRRADPVAGILGYSGRLIGGETLKDEIKAKPRVLLIHGDADPVVPFESLAQAEQALRALGVPVETVRRPRLPPRHRRGGLAPRGAVLEERACRLNPHVVGRKSEAPSAILSATPKRRKTLSLFRPTA